MQAQISKKIGSGIHFLIPVKRDIYDNKNLVTMGTKKKYITTDDFKRLGLKIQDIDFEKVWAELNYFVKNAQMSLAAFFK
jgi:hypothetical protein